MLETATETKQLIAESARDFAQQFIKPHVMDWDEAQHFPVDVMKQAGSYGFLECLFQKNMAVLVLGIMNM